MPNFITFIIFTLIVGTSIAHLINICLDRKTICQSYEVCVTWERGCSMGANCLQPGVYEKFSECVQVPVKPPLLPSKSLCKSNEVFSRGADKLCARPLCPPRLGYNCYPQRGTLPSCFGIRCPFGMYCVIGDSCTDYFCEPKPVCKYNY